MFKSAPNLLAEANHGLLSNLEKCILVFAREPSYEQRQAASEIEAKWFDVQDEEFAMAKKEMSGIIVSVTNRGITHWDTESKHQQKDRYSAILIGSHMLKVAKDESIETQDRELVQGHWLGENRNNNSQSQTGFFDDASL